MYMQQLIDSRDNGLINSCNLYNAGERKKLFKAMKQQMIDHADKLEFEEAASIRDLMEELKKQYGDA